MDKVNQIKRRKSKDNTSKTTTTDIPPKKRLPVKYDWKQTDCEVHISLYYGQGLDESCYTLNSSNDHCAVQFKDGKEWHCKFNQSVVDAGTSVECRGNHLVLMLIKNIPDRKWDQLEASMDEEVVLENGSAMNEEEESQLPLENEVVKVKKDLTEMADGLLVIYLYVKSVQKESVAVEVDGQNLRVSFFTKDKKFLEDHFCTSKDGARFAWRVKLKDFVLADCYNYTCTACHIAITLHKMFPQKKWDTIEAIAMEPKTKTVKHDTWIPMVTQAKTLDMPKTSLTEFSTKSLQSVVEPDIVNKEIINKPTCKVTPMNKMLLPDAIAPGLTGLKNLGNTCFMNSVIQCLVNCREFRDYFLGPYCQKDVNTTNPLGMEGKLAFCFAGLCRMLWDGKRECFEPSQLKNFISMKASQFTGFAQHDAQEFMAFLLDGLHEDLNRISVRPYIEAKDWDGRPDKVVADESWSMYKMRNDSIVVDLFQGQYKSKLVCPICQKVSITFDPFLYLSVPLPKKVRVIPIVFFAKDPMHRPVKYSLRIPQDATAEELKVELSRKCKVKPENLRVFEVYKNKIHCFFNKGNSLGSVSPSDLIFAFEVWSEKLANEPVVEVNVMQRLLMPTRASRCSSCKRDCSSGENKLKRCTKCYRASYCDQTCQRNHWTTHKDSCKWCPELVGLPFIVSLPRSKATYSRLCQLMEAYARYSVDVFQPPVQVSDSLSLQGISSTTTATKVDSRLGDERRDFSPSFKFDQSTVCSELLDGQQLDTNAEVAPFSPPCLSPPFSPVFATISTSEVVVSKHTAEECECSGDQSTGDASNVQVVVGHPRSDSKVERAEPLFFINPINKHGISLPGFEPCGMSDKGEEPLVFQSLPYVALDWRNDERLKNYVLVQSKDLDADCEQSDLELREEHNNITLDQCLNLFTEPEILSPGEAWYCPKCKQHREATKQMSIWRLPPVLIIQLKRFAFNCLNFRDKIDKLVKYPIRGLDLSSYYCGPTAEECGEQLPIYDLFAVINHQGSLLGGHYTAIAKLLDTTGRNCSEIDWRLFDDSCVTFTQESSALSKYAYVLFYRRRGLPFQFNPCIASMVENLGIPKSVTALTIADVNTESSEEEYTTIIDGSDKMDDDLPSTIPFGWSGTTP